jgi:hypothetical protein
VVDSSPLCCVRAKVTSVYDWYGDVRLNSKREQVAIIDVFSSGDGGAGRLSGPVGRTFTSRPSRCQGGAAWGNEVDSGRSAVKRVNHGCEE